MNNDYDAWLSACRSLAGGDWQVPPHRVLMHFFATHWSPERLVATQASAGAGGELYRTIVDRLWHLEEMKQGALSKLLH